MCRSKLPMNAQRMFDDASSRYCTLEYKAALGRTSWDSLTDEEQRDMIEVEGRLREAGKAGMSMAYWCLACMYGNGQGVKQDSQKEFEYLKKAADKNVPQAAGLLAKNYLFGENVKKNVAEGIRLLHFAASENNAPAQFILGQFYEAGELVKQDYSEALKLFEKAAAQGHAKAYSNLGVLYAQGKGLPAPDYTKSAQFYTQAAGLGDAMAMSNLASCYFNGRGVAQSVPEAVRWWTKAAALGHPSAAKNLAAAKQYDEYIGGIPATPPSAEMTPEGKRVQIKGLVSKSELNGLNGVIVGTLDGADGKLRCIVELDGERGRINVKASNVIMAIQLKPR